MKTIYVYLNTGTYTAECDNHMDVLLLRLEKTGDIIEISRQIRDDRHDLTEIELQCNDWAFRFLRFMYDCDMICALERPLTRW